MKLWIKKNNLVVGIIIGFLLSGAIAAIAATQIIEDNYWSINPRGTSNLASSGVSFTGVPGLSIPIEKLPEVAKGIQNFVKVLEGRVHTYQKEIETGNRGRYVNQETKEMFRNSYWARFMFGNQAHKYIFPDQQK